MANNKQLINIRDRIDLYLGSGPTYRSMLEDITSNGNLLVSIPTHKGIPLELSKGQGLQLYFYRQNGRFRANVKVVDFRVSNVVRLIELKVLSEPQKQQRRDSFRLQASIKVVTRPFETGILSEKSLNERDQKEDENGSMNISASGIAIRTKKMYFVGDTVHMRIHLKWPDENAEPLEVIGEVRQTYMVDPLQKIYCVGIVFRYTSDDIYGHLSKYVMVQEQKRLKQKRLVEDD